MSFSIGFFILAALPLTYTFQVKNIRFIFFGAIIVLFFMLILGGIKIKAGKIFLISSIFFLIAIISFPLSGAPIYGLSKLSLSLGYFYMLPLVLINVIKFEKQEKLFIFGLCFSGLLLISITYFYYGGAYELIRTAKRFSRLKLGEGANPIMTARYFGVGIISFLFVISTCKSFALKIIFFIFSIISFLYVIATGSKGPVVALILALLIFVYFASKNRKTWIFFTILGLVIAGLVLMAVIPHEFIMQRVINKVGSLSGRLPVFLNALSYLGKSDLVELAIGHGFGDFGYYFTGKDVRVYPHNIFLELFFEVGLIGLIVFVWWLIYPVTNYLKSKKNKLDRTGGFILAVYVFSVINAQFSGDLPANYFIPVFASLLIAHTSVLKRIKV